jgi:hypothetical protein
VIEVPGAEASLDRVEAKHDVALFENNPVLITQHSQQNSAF